MLIEFDTTLAKAEALLRDVPLRSDLSDQEIGRIADYHYASMLAEDDEWRQDGPQAEELFQSISKKLRGWGRPVFATSFKIEQPSPYGLSDREMTKAIGYRQVTRAVRRTPLRVLGLL